MQQPICIRARRIAPLAERPGEVAPWAKPQIVENGMLLIAGGKIQAVGRKLALPPRCIVHDYGEVTLLPQLVNSHTHLQLSWLAGKTDWHLGFVPWLQSLLRLLLPAIPQGLSTSEQLASLSKACAALRHVRVADTGGSLSQALTRVRAAAQANQVDLYQFCEWFGFGEMKQIWPERCAGEQMPPPPFCAPCGHALYSTAPEILQRAHAWCKVHNSVFSFHLAESLEETELLQTGAGPLYELYRPTVLPKNWLAPGLRPLAYAHKLGLLAPGSLAAHGVQLTGAEIREFAETGAALALCPRSNANLGVGLPRVHELLANGVLLCLGTDGLTSCQDLDIRNEAAFCREKLDLPQYAVWRMATINGAFALGSTVAGLRPGQPAKFSVWKDDV